MLAVAGVSIVLIGPLRRKRDAIPYPPDEGGRMVMVAPHDVLEQLAAALAPDGMVVAVDHAALGVGGVGIRVKGMSAVVHNSKVGIVACHPLRRGAVRCQHHVEPHRQAVLGREVEHRVVVVEVVRVARRLHPVPVRCAAHDSKPRRPDVGEVLVPELRFGRAAAIVFDADRERCVGVGEPLGHVLHLRGGGSGLYPAPA